MHLPLSKRLQVCPGMGNHVVYGFHTAVVLFEEHIVQFICLVDFVLTDRQVGQKRRCA